MSERVITLALTYGEPPRAVFWDQFRYSLSILKRLTRRVAPIPRPILPLIAVKRGRLRVRTWREESFSSPLERITLEQAAALSAKLREIDPDRAHDVRVVYEFRAPLLTKVLDEIMVDPPDRLLILPIYLPDSDFTTGISKTDLETWVRTRGRAIDPAPEYVTHFSEDNGLVALMARHVEEQLREAGWSDADCAEAGLLLAAHGTLVNAPPGVDTGLGTTLCYYHRLAELLAPRFAHTSAGWLNHTLGGEWTQPALDIAAEDMVRRGIRRVVHCTFGFLADNAETLLEGRMVLREFDKLDVLHLECLNTWPPFIEHLARRVVDQLNGIEMTIGTPTT